MLSIAPLALREPHVYLTDNGLPRDGAMGKILAPIWASLAILTIVPVVAACSSPAGKTHAAAVSHSTSAAPTPSATASPREAWWVFEGNKPSDVRVFHGTDTAAINACTSCSYPPTGPYSTKAIAEKQAAQDRTQLRAQLLAQRRAKARAHRRWLHRTVDHRTDRIVYTVTGTGYPSVQYGSDSNTVDVPGGYGPLGDGVALPFTASQRNDPNALYFAVSAQLEGGGDITATVTEVQTTVYKDGHSVRHVTRLAHAHAAGGYAIANAQYNTGF